MEKLLWKLFQQIIKKLNGKSQKIKRFISLNFLDQHFLAYLNSLSE